VQWSSVQGNPQGKRPLEKPSCRWVDNNEMDLAEMGWGSVNWIGLAQDRKKWRALVNEPSGSIKC
jgi:hypothetical protein